MTLHREQRRRILIKGLFIIHECVYSNIFEKIIDKEMSKGAWNTFDKIYGGDEKLKKVKLEALSKQYKMTQTNEGESVTDFFSRLCPLPTK
jgi:hypothetical protein